MEATKKRRVCFELEDIEVFLRFNTNPKTITKWGARPIFEHACKNFPTENDQLLCKSKRVVIMTKH